MVLITELGRQLRLLIAETSINDLKTITKFKAIFTLFLKFFLIQLTVNVYN